MLSIIGHQGMQIKIKNEMSFHAYSDSYCVKKTITAQLHTKESNWTHTT